MDIHAILYAIGDRLPSTKSRHPRVRALINTINHGLSGRSVSKKAHQIIEAHFALDSREEEKDKYDTSFARQKSLASLRVARPGDDPRRQSAIGRHHLDENPDIRQKTFFSKRRVPPSPPQQHRTATYQKTSSRKPRPSPERRGQKSSPARYSSDDDSKVPRKPLSGKPRPPLKHGNKGTSADRLSFEQDSGFSQKSLSEKPRLPSKHGNLRSIMDTLREIEGRGKRLSSNHRPYKSFATTAIQKSISGHYCSDQDPGFPSHGSSSTHRLHKSSTTTVSQKAICGHYSSDQDPGFPPQGSCSTYRLHERSLGESPLPLP